MGESKIEDFSEPITAVNGAKIAVFWDVEDCPFPVGSNPDMIYHKIESTFREMDLEGKVSIWAYFDENNGSEFLRKKTSDARIYFLPGGDKLSRRYRMLNDILFWVMDSPVDLFDHPEPATLILVSDKVSSDTKFFRLLRNLTTYRRYGVFLVTPTQHVQEWPGSLFDDVYCFSCESQSSEPSHKKHKAELRGEGSEHQG